MGAESKRVVEWRRRMKLRALVYKGGRCIACSYQRCPGAISFHHLDPAEKDFSLSSSATRSWSRVKPELDKCVALCHNCHTEVHLSMLDLAPHMSKNPSPEQGDEYVARSEFAVRPPRDPRGCPHCGMAKSRAGKQCRKCAARHNTVAHTPKIQWPPVEELRRLVAEHSFLHVSRMLGVSDNAIRKHLRNHS